MRSQPELLSAARLIAFANLEPTANNWQTLWRPGGYPEKRRTALDAPRCAPVKAHRGLVQEWQALATAQPVGELWRAFVDGAREAAGGAKRVPRSPCWTFSLTGAWSDRGRDDVRPEWPEFEPCTGV
jgi:hypothetical protein